MGCILKDLKKLTAAAIIKTKTSGNSQNEYILKFMCLCGLFVNNHACYYKILRLLSWWIKAYKIHNRIEPQD